MIFFPKNDKRFPCIFSNKTLTCVEVHFRQIEPLVFEVEPDADVPSAGGKQWDLYGKRAGNFRVEINTGFDGNAIGWVVGLGIEAEIDRNFGLR